MLDKDIALGWPYVYIHDMYVCKCTNIYINRYMNNIYIYINTLHATCHYCWYAPLPVAVTARITIFFEGNPY